MHLSLFWHLLVPHVLASPFHVLVILFFPQKTISGLSLTLPYIFFIKANFFILSWFHAVHDKYVLIHALNTYIKVKRISILKSLRLVNRFMTDESSTALSCIFILHHLKRSSHFPAMLHNFKLNCNDFLNFQHISFGKLHDFVQFRLTTGP